MKSSGSKSSHASKSSAARRGRETTRTGAGSEAAAGIRRVSAAKRSGRDTTPRDVDPAQDAGTTRAGSEPLIDRNVVHESGYGGKGGRPRTSSDQREGLAEPQRSSRK